MSSWPALPRSPIISPSFACSCTCSTFLQLQAQDLGLGAYLDRYCLLQTDVIVIVVVVVTRNHLDYTSIAVPFQQTVDKRFSSNRRVLISWSSAGTTISALTASESVVLLVSWEHLDSMGLFGHTCPFVAGTAICALTFESCQLAPINMTLGILFWGSDFIHFIFVLS